MSSGWQEEDAHGHRFLTPYHTVLYLVASSRHNDDVLQLNSDFGVVDV